MFVFFWWILLNFIWILFEFSSFSSSLCFTLFSFFLNASVAAVQHLLCTKKNQGGGGRWEVRSLYLLTGLLRNINGAVVGGATDGESARPKPRKKKKPTKIFWNPDEIQEEKTHKKKKKKKNKNNPKKWRKWIQENEIIEANYSMGSKREWKNQHWRNMNNNNNKQMIWIEKLEEEEREIWHSKVRRGGGRGLIHPEIPN